MNSTNKYSNMYITKYRSVASLFSLLLLGWRCSSTAGAYFLCFIDRCELGPVEYHSAVLILGRHHSWLVYIWLSSAYLLIPSVTTSRGTLRHRSRMSSPRAHFYVNLYRTVTGDSKLILISMLQLVCKYY